MSLVPLPAPPSAVPTLDADPGVVETCGVQLRAACTRVDDLGTFAAGPGRIDAWEGQSSRAYHRTTATIGRGAEAMSSALRRVAGRVLDHADSLADLRRRHDDLVRTSTVLANGIEMLRHDVEAAVPDRIVELAPVLRARSEAVAGHVAAYESERRRWVLDLAAEERAMIAAFERVLTLESIEERYGGAPDPADEALESMPSPDQGPGEVRAWWRSLTPAQRAGLVVAAPGAIGNLAGVPALARHRANTARLERDLAGLRPLREQGLLSDAERTVLRNAEAAAAARDQAAAVRDPHTGEPVPVRLYLYDPTAFGGDGAVAVAVGDPDRADDVSVLVPGMSTDATGIGALTGRAVSVYAAARGVDPSASHAALAWIGYDAPDNVPVLDGASGDLLGVLGEGLAEEGGEHLSDAVDGLRAERVRPPADLTVIGHSYGSTTVGHAAHDHGLAVDDLVVLGSPGLGGDVDHAADLHLDPDRVWVGSNSHDLVSDLADQGSFDTGTLLGLGLGADPAEDNFGAVRFRAETVDGGPGVHDAYFDRDTESLHNIAAIVTGHPDLVERAAPVTDPWWRGPVDPERGREATSPTMGSP